MAGSGIKFLYISGEESLRQIKLQGFEMGGAPDSLKFLCETNLAVITDIVMQDKPQAVVIDSIQTMYSDEEWPRLRAAYPRFGRRQPVL